MNDDDDDQFRTYGGLMNWPPSRGPEPPLSLAVEGDRAFVSAES